MSEHAVTLVELSLTAADAQARAEAVRDWLLAAAVVVANPAPDALTSPSGLLPGPEAEARATDGAIVRGLRNSGVDIVVGRQLFDSGMNFEPPQCPGCAAPLAVGAYVDLLGEWVESGEPATACPECGQAALLGDWPGDCACHVGELGVRFNNWPLLRARFMDELGHVMGVRYRVVLGHH